MALYINGEAIGQSLIESEIQRLRPSYEQVFRDQSESDREKQLAEWARENIIEAVIFRQEANKTFPEIESEAIQFALEKLMERKDQQIDAEAEAALRPEIANQIRCQRLTQKITADIPEPTEKAIRKHYEQHLDRFTIPETIHAAHIVKHPSPETTPDQLKEAIEAIHQQIEGGAVFEELAAQHSDCPEQAGDLGFFARGKMVPAFEEVAFDLEPGTYSEPFETEFGWHIVKVYETRPAVPCPLKQVREVIARDLKQRADETAIEAFLDACKVKIAIEDR